MDDITIAALTDIRPMGILPGGNNAELHIIVSEQSYQQLLEIGENLKKDNANDVYLTSDQPLKLQDELEKIQKSVGMNRLSYYNFYKYQQQEEQILLLISVFTYAFIILITAICVANILNTISTSIALRTREFAMLKSVGITPRVLIVCCISKVFFMA